MAPILKERSGSGKVIIVQIMLILILFSHVTSANMRCWGAPQYLLSFENRLGDDDPKYDMKKQKMSLYCQGIGGVSYTVPLNPIGYFHFCGGWIVDPVYLCWVQVPKYSTTVRGFIAFGTSFFFDCKKTRHCHFQLHKEYVYYYSPTQKKYIKDIYKLR